MSAQEYEAPESVGRLEKRALVVGVLGLVVSIVGWITKPEDFFRSYLVAFLLVLGLSLGSLGLLMLQHLTGGQWGILIRRPLESATRVLWLVFFLNARRGRSASTASPSRFPARQPGCTQRHRPEYRFEAAV